MAYPGNPELSPDAQDRVLTTFREVIRNLQAGRRDEAMIGLEFVLRLDPAFAPAVDLQRQLAAGAAELDLSSVLETLSGPSPEELNAQLVEAVDLFNERRFLEAKQAVEQVLRELPGHPEARQLLNQVQEALKLEAQVGGFLSQAREALDRGDGQEAANFVLMAQALDPNHPGIASMLQELQQAAPGAAAATPETGAPAPSEEEPAIRFETIDEPEPATAAGSGPEAAAGKAAAGFSLDSGAAPDEGFSFDFGGDAGSGFALEEDGSAAEAPPSGTSVEAPGDDLGDLFSLPEEEAGAPQEGGGEEGGQGPDDRVAELLEKGQRAFEAGAYQEAIDVWSRIYLIDPSSEAAGERIDAARARMEEQSRELELLFHQAMEAADEGRPGEALELLETILSKQPGHIEALDLKERLEREAEQPPAGPEEAPAPSEADAAASAEAGSADSLPEIDGDLFREELPAQIPTPEQPFEIPELPPAPAPAAPRRRRLPVRTLALAAAALLVVGVGAWLGSRILAGHGEERDTRAVERTLREADRLYRSGRVEEAVHLLQEAPASPVDQARIARRIARYQKALQPPTPTPVPQVLTAAEQAARNGSWLRAYRLVLEGLRDHPDDPGLLELKDQIVQQEPLVVSLERARARRDPRTALSVARQLAERHPGDPDIQAELDRELFNAAAAELNTYNLTGAEVLLSELARRQPEDEEVARILELIRTYKNRPVDMQLKIFISSITPR